MRGEEYHAGDRVVIREWEEMVADDVDAFFEYMTPLCGQEAVITRIERTDEIYDLVYLSFVEPDDFNSRGWAYTTDMIRHADRFDGIKEANVKGIFDFTFNSELVGGSYG